MTREEAVRVIKEIHPTRNRLWLDQWLEMFVQLGMLKLEPPFMDAEQAALSAMVTHTTQFTKEYQLDALDAFNVLAALNRVGLKVVRK